MASTLQAFTNDTFGTVRTIEQEGKVYFCGRDVASALGYVNTKDALARHCKGVVNHCPETDEKTMDIVLLALLGAGAATRGVLDARSRIHVSFLSSGYSLVRLDSGHSIVKERWHAENLDPTLDDLKARGA